jgi:hypothetical protein
MQDLELEPPYDSQIRHVTDQILSQLSGDTPDLSSIDLQNVVGLEPEQVKAYRNIKAYRDTWKHGAEVSFELPGLKDDLWYGTYVLASGFKGFEHWRIKQQLLRLSTDYASYEKIKLGDLSIAMNLTKDRFSNVDDAVYVPLIGTKPAEVNFEELTIKHQNYCQIVVKTDRVFPAFFANFLNSTLGRRILALKKSEKTSVIPRFNRSDLAEIEIAVPPFAIQEKIINTQQTIDSVQTSLEQLRSNLSLNPISSPQDLEKLEMVAKATTGLSAADTIKSLIREGESKRLEFKETFGWDVRQKKRSPDLELEVIRTVAGFLNSDGGTLLVGVHDQGGLKGLDVELLKLHRGSKDQFLLYLKDKLKKKIGQENYDQYDSLLLPVDGVTILKIDCKRSPSEVYIDDKDFYVRTSPATEKIEGRAQSAYIKMRFSKDKLTD